MPLGRCFLAHYKDLHSVGDNVLMSGISSGEHTDWASASRFLRWRQNILISNPNPRPGLSFLIACLSHRGDNLNLIERDVFPSSFTLHIPISLMAIYTPAIFSLPDSFLMFVICSAQCRQPQRASATFPAFYQLGIGEILAPFPILVSILRRIPRCSKEVSGFVVIP